MTRCFRTVLMLVALVLFAVFPALADHHMGGNGKDKAIKEMKDKTLPGQAASGEGEKTGHEDKAYGEDRGDAMKEDAMDKGKEKMMEKANDKGMMKKPTKSK